MPRIEDTWNKVGVLNLALAPLSWLYGFGWRCYQAIYQLGLKHAAEPHPRVICVGNLTAGGSGKSPFVVFLAKKLVEMGHDVVLSCSGYGSPSSEQANLAPEGLLDPTHWGDEPAMIRDLLPDIPMIVGRNRVRAAQLCNAQFPDSVLLLDDGFQHLPLKKHLSILLESDSRENRFAFPAGPYRQPYQNGLKLADLVIPGDYRIEGKITHIESGANPNLRLEAKGHLTVQLLCSIANPHRFAEAIRLLGFQVERFLFLPDHAPMHQGNLFESINPEIPLIVTEKDWVKLRLHPETKTQNIWIAKYQVQVLPEEEFTAWLKEKIEKLG